MNAAPFRFSVVTVIHNSGDVVLDMVRGLPVQAAPIVVDNASTDGAAAEIRVARPGTVILELLTNGGFGVGCNVGARAADDDVVIFLNPDCRPRPGALELLAASAAAEPGSVFGPAILDDRGVLQHSLRRRSVPIHEILELLPSARRWIPSSLRRELPERDPRYRVGGTVDYLQGACLATTRARFFEVGGFDEDYFLYSEEETLCNAVKELGGRCIYTPQAVIEHVGGTSTKQVSSFAQRHAYRSRAIFYRKRYGDVLGVAVILGIALAAIVNVMTSRITRRLQRERVARTSVGVDALRGLLAGTTAAIDR